MITIINHKYTVMIAIILLFVGACTPPTNPTPTITPTPMDLDGGEAIADTDQAAVDANMVGVDQPADTLDATYTNEQTGFSFDYPGDWYLETDPGFTVVLTSYESGEGDDEINDEETKIDFLILDSDEQLDALVEAQRQEIIDAGGTVSGETTMDTDSGMTAYILIQSMHEGMESVVAVAQMPNVNLLISGQGDLTLFNTILASLRPTG